MTELEAKLVVPDEATFQALASLETIGPFRVRPRAIRLQQDTYVDTPGLRLYRARYACRLRHVGHRARATLKGLGGVAGALHSREEIEQEIDNPSVGALLRMEDEPGPTVRRLTAGEGLTALFSLVTERRVAEVGDAERRRFEMGLDRTRFFGPRGESLFLEVELESLDGDRGLLDAAAAELRQRYGLTDSGLSKFARGLTWAEIRMP